jgi:quercetin dioxygenase-like cupin family protein
MHTRYLVCGLAVVSCAFAQSTVVVENDQVKVLHVTQKPKDKTALHEHKANRVMIYENAGKQIMVAGGKQSTLEFKAGEVKWSPISGMHTAELVSSNPVTIVEIELKKPGNPAAFQPGPLDPVKVDPKHYKVEFENDQVRVLRVKIGPHESTPLHAHSANRVVSYLTAQDIRVTSQDGKVENAKREAGGVTWSGKATHKEENLSDKPFEVVVAEIK